MTKAEYYAMKKQAAANYAASNPAYAKRQEQWKLKQSGGFVPVGENAYTIDMPGVRDIFKLPLPYMQDKALKRERFHRWQTAKTPIPEWLQWIQPVVTTIDNAQDLLYTAFWLAKPLLRRLPMRFVPYVGWGLLIMDIMNLANSILSKGLTPTISKPCLKKVAKNYRHTRDKEYWKWKGEWWHTAKEGHLVGKYGTEAMRSFLAPAGWRRWMGFALQAPQALESITGYGIVLGSIMGAISNVVWSIPKALSGDKIVWRGPPPADPASKAFNYLTSEIFTHNMRDILTPEEHAMLILAHNAALSIIFDSTVLIDFERTNTIQDLPVMSFEPWDLTTLEVLEEEGVDLREPSGYFTTIQNPTYDKAVQEAITEWPNWTKRMREIAGEGDYERWSVVYQVYTESSHDTLEAVTGISKDEFTDDNYIIKACQEFAALDMMPLVPPSEEQIAGIINLALIKAHARGSAFPNPEDWKTSIEEICGPVVSKVQRITKDLEWNMQKSFSPGVF